VVALFLPILAEDDSTDGKVEKTESAETDAFSPKGAVGDFVSDGKKAKAWTPGCTGTVVDGSLTVESAHGTLDYTLEAMTCGGTACEFKADKTVFSSKVAKTKRSENVQETVIACEKGFKHAVELKKSEGQGDLVLLGKITTVMKIEKNFPCDFEAKEFKTDGPVVFLTSGLDRAFCIGRTDVVDADGQTLACTVSYKEVEGGYTFEVLVPWTWLEFATYPIQIDPLIGSAASATAGNGVNDINSASAFGAGKYLLGYRTDASFGDVYARFINADGTLSGSAFAVATGGTSQNWPRIAYASGSGGVFAIVHIDGNDVWLRRYNTSGTLLGSVAVNNTTTCDRVSYADVASDGSGNFCVMFVGFKSPSGFYKLWGEVRSTSGSLVTDDTELSSGTASEVVRNVDATWNSTLSEWGAVWVRSNTAWTSWQVRSRAWSSTLGAAGFAETTVATNFYPLGSEFVRVAFNSGDNEYLAVWPSLVGSSESRVICQRVNADSGALVGSTTDVETGANWSAAQDVEYTPTGDRYVVIFKYYVSSPASGGIYGQAILTDGTRWSSRFTINDDSTTVEDQSRLSYNPTGDQFLAHWTDTASGSSTSDIWYGRLDMTPPDPPTGITTSNTATTITLTWPADPDVKTYSIGRATTSGGPYSFPLDWRVTRPLGGWGPTASFTDTTPATNVVYYYVVTAQDDYLNTSFYSAEVSEVIDTIPPAAPTGLSGTSGDGEVDLTWSPNSEPDLAGYNVYYRLTGTTSWTRDNSSLVTTTSWTVDGLTNGVNYDFAITAVDTEPNESAFSSVVVVKPKDTTIPDTPTGLAATAGNREVDLTWDPNSEPDLAGYNLYRATAAGGPYTKINASLITATSYTDSPLTNGTTYYFKVSAVDTSDNESALSSTVSATPMYPAPTGLTHTSSTYNSVTLEWTAPGEPDVAGYNVYRSSTSGGPYTMVNPSLVTTTSYTDSGLSSGTYYYVVTAVSTGSEESGYSSEVSAATTPVPPPTLSSSNTRKTNDQTPAITGTTGAGWIVKLYEGPTLIGEGTADGTGGFTIATSVVLGEGAHVIQATATVPVPGDPTSGLSSGVVVTVDITPPATPTGLTLIAGDGWVDARWDANEELDLLGYDIYRHIVGSPDPWLKLNDKPLVNNRYLDKTVTNGVAYEYKVAALDDALDED
jgi:fibronectin type 3 domain-containing protein